MKSSIFLALAAAIAVVPATSLAEGLNRVEAGTISGESGSGVYVKVKNEDATRLVEMKLGTQRESQGESVHMLLRGGTKDSSGHTTESFIEITPVSMSLGARLGKYIGSSRNRVGNFCQFS